MANSPADSIASDLASLLQRAFDSGVAVVAFSDRDGTQYSIEARNRDVDVWWEQGRGWLSGQQPDEDETPPAEPDSGLSTGAAFLVNAVESARMSEIQAAFRHLGWKMEFEVVPDEPTAAEPACDHDGAGLDMWFDRTICQPPCGTMHNRCTACGAAVGGCANEGTAP